MMMMFPIEVPQAWGTSMSVSFLKHYYNFSITFNVILRSISSTGKVHSVGPSYITSWDIQKLSSLDLNESIESTSTTALG